MIRTALLLAGMWLMVLFMPATGETAEAEARQDVLVVSSYHEGDRWNDHIIQGLRSELNELPRVVLHVEHLDSRRHRGEDYQDAFARFLSEKYANMDLAAIVVSDNAAFDFILDFRKRFAPVTPLVFCGINNFSPEQIKGIDNIAGVNEMLDFAGNVELILQLFPNSESIGVVAGSKGLGRLNLDLFRKSLAAYSQEVKLREFINLGECNVRDALATLPKGTPVLRMCNLVSADGTDVSLDKSLESIAEAKYCPIFSLWDFDIGKGALGGIVTSSFQQGVTAGSLTARILKGVPADNIPVVMQTPAVAMFDYVQMEKFGIEEEMLPKDAIIINKPDTLLHRHKAAFYGLAVALALAAVTIPVLLYLLAAQRRSEVAVRKSERFLHSLIETISTPIFWKDIDGIYRGCNTAFAASLGLTPEQVIGRSVYEVAPKAMADVYAEMDSALFENPGKQVYESQLKDAQQNQIDVVFHKTTYNDHEGKTEGLVGIAHDITQRKRAELDLRESEHRLQHILENLPVGAILVVDGALRCNRTCTKLTGYDADEIATEEQWFLALFGTASEKRRKLYEQDKAMSFGKSHTLQFQRKTGEVRWGKFSGWTDGKMLIWLIDDVTESVEAREVERQSKARLESIFRAAPVGIGVVTDRIFQEVNEFFCEMLGYTSEELIGQSTRMIYHSEEVFEEVGRAKEEQMAQQHIATIRTQFRRKDGELLEIILRATPMDSSEPVKGETFTALDISELERTQQQLRESEKRIRSVIELSPLAIGLTSSSGNLIDCNMALANMLGVPRDALLGRRIHEFTHPDDLTEGQDLLRALWAGERDNYSVEKRYIRADGTEIWVSLLASIFRSKAPGMSFSFAFVEDISERKEYQENLRLAKEAAEAANRSKSEFLANMSHEIRTPLNGVMGMLQLVHHSQLDEEQRRFIDTAILSCQRLTGLLSDILDLSRIEAGKLSIVSEELNVAGLLHEVVDTFGVAVAQKGLDLRLTVDERIPPRLMGDPMRLRQIVVNLVGNAIKFTEVGSVSVEAWRLPDLHEQDQVRVLFSVKDTGNGISDSKLKKIFEVFFQGEDTYTKRYQGAGLGLPIVRRLLELLGGTMSVESKLGEGTAFYLCLTLQLASEKAPVVINCGTNVSAPCKILLVEDEPVNMLSTTRLLEVNGHRVSTASNGLEALEMLESEDFDIVLMDVQMPEMNGVEATSEIRNSPALAAKKDTPVIGLTAYAMESDRQAFLAAGMDGVLTKPVVIEELEQLIWQLVIEDRPRGAADVLAQ